MSWFFFALITVLCWGGADLFYKRGNLPGDRFSHVKTSIAVGLVMGIHALIVLLTDGISFDFRNLLYYLPVSAFYILSMTIGYFGLRYLELSIISPVQNSSGAIVCILCVIFLRKTLEPLPAAAVAIICFSLCALGFFEWKYEKKNALPHEKKYISGPVAMLFPLLYCVFDALGTYFDAFYLDSIETTPLVGATEETLETVANLSYELTFSFVAVLLLIYLLIRGEPLRSPRQGSRFSAALLETGGQFTYVFAMARNAAASAPMIASYSIVSLLLSRIFLKEKLTAAQYCCIAGVMIGIIILGIFDL